MESGVGQSLSIALPQLTLPGSGGREQGGGVVVPPLGLTPFISC